jgi:glutamate/tyrosine decarboxylase-like PLP-dependent enzyme
MLKNYIDTVGLNLTLDPDDWAKMRELGHRMIDDMMDHLEQIREQPSWRIMPLEAKQFLQKPVPLKPEDINNVYQEFKQYIFPYNKGNIHPRFFAWVQGTGTPFGVLAEMLAATMNPNNAIGEHAAMYVELQVIEWCKQMLNYPREASGILLSGASMANVTALTIARDHQVKLSVRQKGLRNVEPKMVLYCSEETHSCVQKAVELIGLGTESIRKISTDSGYKIIPGLLVDAIEKDISEGFTPFCIVGNAGTVNTGAIDPLEELTAIAKKYKLWLHIDGAFGALAKMVPEYEAQLKYIEQADSLAFDLHKWMYMPYEIACVLVRNKEAHRNSFAITPSYLEPETSGLAGGPEPFNNYGPELSRGFKSLKVWMSLKEHGLEKYIAMIRQNIAQAFYMGHLIEQEKELELLTPVTLNIVCYRFKKETCTNDDLNRLNKEILIRLQEQGIASPSSTILKGSFAIRVAIVNQRSRQSDFELLVKETLRIGNELMA